VTGFCKNSDEPLGRAIVQTAKRWLAAPELVIQTRVTSFGIRGGRNDTAVCALVEFFQFSPANHHSTIAPYSSVSPLRDAIDLIGQHIITYLCLG
jgi:hypothetical protein